MNRLTRIFPPSRWQVAVLVAVSLASTAAPAADERTDAGPVRLVRNTVTGGTNQVATIAFGAGARNCAPRIDQVVGFLTRGTTASSALLFVPERDPDTNTVSVSMEIKTDGMPRAYASASFAPNTGIGCGAEYETVQYWSESCTAVAGKTFKGATPMGSMGGEIAILAIGPTARVFLMRATPTACVTIKKEVLR